MAGDWIKIEHATPDKPEVDVIANLLSIDHDSVTGKLVRLWIWADQQSLDGNGLSVTEMMIDRITFQNGFAKALRKCGWLTGDNGNLSLPNFDINNGQTAKKRASTNRRVAKSRELKRKSNAPGVTKSEQKALPEKRREEKSNKEAKASCPISDVIKFIWNNSLKVSRERSSQKQLATAWGSIPKASRPALEVIEHALDAWKESKKWKEGFAEGIHIWIKNRQWENLPEKPEAISKPCKTGSSKIGGRKYKVHKASDFELEQQK